MEQRSETRRAFDWQEASARLERLARALASGGGRSPEQAARILEERARALARPAAEETAPGEELEILVFCLSGERYGIEAHRAVEVVPLRGLTPVPCTPACVAGLIHHRGRVLPVLDLRPLLDLPAQPPAETARVVAIEVGGMTFGILADSVAGTLRAPGADVVPPPVGRDGGRPTLVQGVTRSGVAILDTEAVAEDPRILVREEFR